MASIDEQLEVLQAYKDGKTIESLYLNSMTAGWVKLSPSWRPVWNWADYDYRVAKEPERIWLYVLVPPSRAMTVEVPVLDKHKSDYEKSWQEAGYRIVSVTPFVKE